MVNFNEISNEDLYKMCIRGDQGAWRYVHNYVLKICRRKEFNLHNAEDIASEVCIAIIGKINEVKEEAIKEVCKPSTFRSYLRTATFRRIIDSYRGSFGPDIIKLASYLIDIIERALDTRDTEPANALALLIADTIKQKLTPSSRNSGHKPEKITLAKEIVSIVKQELKGSVPGADHSEFVLEIVPFLEQWKRQIHHAPPSHEPGPDDQLWQLEVTSLIDLALEKMKSPCKEVLTVYFQYKQEMYDDYDEMSTVLGMAVPTISSHVTRCLRKFVAFREIESLRLSMEGR